VCDAVEPDSFVDWLLVAGCAAPQRSGPCGARCSQRASPGAACVGVPACCARVCALRPGAAQAQLHPSSAYSVPGLWHGVHSPHGFGSCADELARGGEALEEVGDRLRRCCEAADQLQGGWLLRWVSCLQPMVLRCCAGLLAPCCCGAASAAPALRSRPASPVYHPLPTSALTLLALLHLQASTCWWTCRAALAASARGCCRSWATSTLTSPAATLQWRRLRRRALRPSGGLPRVHHRQGSPAPCAAAGCAGAGTVAWEPFRLALAGCSQHDWLGTPLTRGPRSPQAHRRHRPGARAASRDLQPLRAAVLPASWRPGAPSVQPRQCVPEQRAAGCCD
jgi:hypothetical protein